MIKEFKEFIAKGNAIDLAMGVVIGAAFSAIINSIVKDLIMPLVALATHGADFENKFVVLRGPDGLNTLAQAEQAGAVTLNYGRLINASVSFVIIAFVVFLLVKMINKIRKLPPPPDMKECPRCLTEIPAAASRCPACTVDL